MDREKGLWMACDALAAQLEIAQNTARDGDRTIKEQRRYAAQGLELMDAIIIVREEIYGKDNH